MNVKTNLMGVATNGGDTFNSEVEGLNGEPGLLEEGHDETA